MFGVYDWKHNALDYAGGGKLKQFKNDCFSVKCNGFLLEFEGVVLNRNSVKIKEDLIKAHKKPDTIPKSFYGSYVCTIWDRDNGSLIILNDLLSKRSLFYMCIGSQLIFSDSYLDLLNYAKENGIELTVDSLGLKMMNRCRFFYDDITYFNEIKFLRGYEYIEVNAKGVKIRRIDLPEMMPTFDRQDTLKKMDLLFNEAVVGQYKKNEEYGFEQVTTLSGGWDSRTVLFYGLKNGYTKQKCFTYSENNSVDFSIAQQIAGNKKLDFYFHSISNGNFLLDRDEIIYNNDGQMAYGGATGAYETVASFDTTKWGIVHAGVGGGEVMGDDGSMNEENAYAALEKKIGCDDTEKTRLRKIFDSYPSYNVFAVLNEVRCCLNSQKSTQTYCLYMSPYLYEPFFELMMNVPYKEKVNRALYREWLDKCCPLEYASTFHLGARTNSEIELILRKILRKGKKFLGIKDKYDMIPFDDWEKKNADVRNYLRVTFESEIGSLKDKLPSEVVDNLLKAWNGQKLYFRIGVLTTTAILNYYYGT